MQGWHAVGLGSARCSRCFRLPVAACNRACQGAHACRCSPQLPRACNYNRVPSLQRPSSSHAGPGQHPATLTLSRLAEGGGGVVSDEQHAVSSGSMHWQHAVHAARLHAAAELMTWHAAAHAVSSISMQPDAPPCSCVNIHCQRLRFRSIHPPPPTNLLLFGRLDDAAQSKIAENTWERTVTAGEILIQEGEVGLAASEMYVVKSGKFEVRYRGGRWCVEDCWSRACEHSTRAGRPLKPSLHAYLIIITPSHPPLAQPCQPPNPGPRAPQGRQHARECQGGRRCVW